MRPWILVIAAALFTAGCASSDPGGAGDTAGTSPSASPSPPPSPSPSPPPSSSPPSPSATAPRAPAAFPVTLARSGGLAGVNERYTVAADGTVTAPAGSPAKHLTGAELAQLRTLITGAAAAAESRHGPYQAPNCRDGFVYTVTGGGLSLSGTDCGTLAREAPTLWKIAQLIEAAARR